MMSKQQWSAGASGASVALALAMLTALGCDDRPASRSARRGRHPATVPSTAPAATDAVDPMAGARTASASQPATRAAATQLANSFLTIDGRITEFPPARLRLTRTDEGVRARLFSDDPKQAVAADYRGNSFDFDILLKIADPKSIADGEYYYRAPSSESDTESPNGIFLNGMRTHLQPQDIAIRFDGDSPKVMARIAGRFLVVNATGDSAPGQFAPVLGTLFTTAEVKDE
jgi:hypothetical protein